MVNGAPLAVGPYTILREIGRGGMGVVYLANDTRLDRQVAIKALPEHLANDPDRLGRFEREAKTLASLNHPNVAGIYGVEEQEGRKYLVLEYVEGETLAERLDRGPLPIDEALEVCTQIAAGVEAAHEAGVIHRDLKPGNIVITPEGKVKVLDFGLAKVAESSASSSFHQAETVTSPAHRQHSPTMPGVILGTAAYMSPEQARGRNIDKRTDIWSFGVVLYECLTGRRPFEGDTMSDLVARILERDPDWSVLPFETTAIIQLLLRRCFAKDRQRRMRDMGDARVELELALSDPSAGGLFAASGKTPEPRSRWSVTGRALVILAAIAVVLGGLLGLSAAVLIRQPADHPVVRFSIDFPESGGQELAIDEYGVPVAVNREGTVIAYSVHEDDIRRIVIRPLGSAEARPVEGTEGGSNPFFSPDGQWLGYSLGNRLMKVPVTGGPPLTVVEAVANNFAWLYDGSIAFAADGGNSIQRVSADGGAPRLVAASDRGERVSGRELFIAGFNTICPVPGAPYILAGVWDGVTIEDYKIVSISLEDGSIRQVIANSSQVQFVAPNQLVFHREGSLFSAPFDPKRGVVAGAATQVLQGVRTGHWADDAHWAVSVSGTLVYIPGGRAGPGRTLIRVDSTGRSEPLMEKPDAIIGGLRVSPDETSVAVLTLRRKIDLWAFDLSRRSFTLLESEGESYSPVWFPGSEEIAYQRLGGEMQKAVLRRRAGTTGVEVVASKEAGDLQPTSVSPDGRFLLLTQQHSPGQQGENIVVIDLDSKGTPQPVVTTTANEESAVFSPDGRWIAYQSNEAGRNQVYVRSFPESGRRWQVSTRGGYAPRWSKDGTKLYFVHRDAIYLCRIGNESEHDFEAGPPEKLFDVKDSASLSLWGVYDVLSNDEFIMVEPAEWEKKRPRIDVVVNWAAELQNP
jgi:eukaryotic-like serine/threonine-protein kinase